MAMAERAAEQSDGRGQVRTAAFVVAAAMLLWVAGSWTGGQLGWPARYAFLLDFSALAAFFWALAVLLPLRFRRRAKGK